MLELDDRIEALSFRRVAIVCAAAPIAAIVRETLDVEVARFDTLGPALRHPVAPCAVVLAVAELPEALRAVRSRFPAALRIGIGEIASPEDVIIEHARDLRAALAANAARLTQEPRARWLVDASAFFACVPLVHHGKLQARIRSTVRHLLARFDPEAQLVHEAICDGTLAFGVAALDEDVFRRFLRQLRVHLDVGLSVFVVGIPTQLPRCLVQRR